MSKREKKRDVPDWIMDYWLEKFGEPVGEWMKTLANYNPDFLESFVKTRQAVFDEGVLSPKTKELIILALHISKGYDVGAIRHTKLGIRNGTFTKEEVNETALLVAYSQGILAYSKYGGHASVKAAEEAEQEQSKRSR